MPDTINQVRDEFYRRYPDGQSTSDAIFLALANDADVDINRELRFRTSEFSFTSLVAGTGEYALDETVISVMEAWYYESATNYWKLRERETSDLSQSGYNWRVPVQGTPHAFYVRPTDTARVLGLLDAPSTATSGGYPKVVIYTTIKKVFTGGENLHSAFKARQLYLSRVCYLHAKTYHENDKAAWLNDYLYTLKEARETLYGIHPYSNPSIRPHGGMRFHRD